MLCLLFQSVVVAVSEKMTVGEALELAINKRQLAPNDHFIRLKMPGSDAYKMPDKSSLLQSEVSIPAGLSPTWRAGQYNLLNKIDK